MSELLKTSVYLDAGTWEALQQVARVRSAEQERRITASEIIREACDRELDRCTEK